ncbi:MAG: hypothetical protein PSX80_00810 [bacterium]|nr:hypothetical protein [bacterium]
MAKTLLYRLFGIGKLPAALIDEFTNEGSLFSDEGIRGTVTYKNFRGGGRVSNWKRQWFAGAIILTKKRLVAYRLRERIIDVTLDDPRLAQMEFTIEEPATLAVSFDANLFQPDWKGRIEYRFRTPTADAIRDHLAKQFQT